VDNSEVIVAHPQLPANNASFVQVLQGGLQALMIGVNQNWVSILIDKLPGFLKAPDYDQSLPLSGVVMSLGIKELLGDKLDYPHGSDEFG